ncbi:olfactory receptor 5V1-like [Rhinophrynus dorsalis]
MVWRNYSVVTEFILLGLTGDSKTQIILFPTFLLCYFCILTGNALIILITFADKKLQTPMYLFLTNLSLIDICYSTAIIPRMLKDLLSSKKVILYGECVAQMYISLSLASAECILLAIMAYDRYLAICYPLHYTTTMNRYVCIKIAAGTWICGFLLTIFLVAFIFNLPMCENNIVNHFLCEPPEVLLLACTDLLKMEYVIFVIGTIIIMIPITFIPLSYIKIIITILKMTSSAGQRKTFSTCASHIMVVTLFYGMAMITYMKPISKYSPENDKMIAIVYTVITPMLNPLIYTLRNKEVKSALINIRNRTIYLKI